MEDEFTITCDGFIDIEEPESKLYYEYGYLVEDKKELVWKGEKN